jgi:replicative DNA helicase
MFEEWVAVQKIVIGYVFSSGKVSALQRARTFLCPEYFTGKYAELWQLLVRYFDKCQEVITLAVLRDLARSQKWTEQRILEYEQVVAECEESAQIITESDVGYYADRLVDLYREVSFNEIMTKGTEFLFKDSYKKARDYVITKLSDLEKIGITYTSEMSLRDGVDEFIQKLSQAKLQQKEKIYFGISSLDNSVLGLWRGDFVLAAGFAGVGKTTFCVHTGVEVAHVQRRNVLYVTTETVIDSLKRRIFARMSRLPMFKVSVSSREMKEGVLTSEQKDTLLQIQQFLKQGDTGQFVVIQAPPEASLAWLRGKLLQYESQFKVELVILDDLRNLRPEARRGQEWEEFNDLLKGCKAIARTHAGRGVPIITPYQTSRAGYKAAREADGNRYDLTALSSSSEAERTPDLVLTLWGNPEDDTDVKLRIIKQRDGESGREVRLRAEWDYQNYFEIEDGSTSFNF